MNCYSASRQVKNMYFYAPNFEEVEGAYWFPVVHPCVHLRHFLMHAISYEPSMLGFRNFIYGFLMEK